MAKYVDVEKVFCADCEDKDRCGSPDLFCDVHSMPVEDVAPVVHGEWIPFHSEAGGDIQYCSACDVGYPHRTDFCPSCGADMRERKNDE